MATDEQINTDLGMQRALGYEDGYADAIKAEGMLDDYQRRANAFINEPQYNGEMDYLLNTALGLTGEGGEFADIVKKLRFHGHPYTPEIKTKLIKELGDVLWYVAQGCKALEVSLSDVAKINIQKLTDRHGEKFSEERSLNKDESKEAAHA